MSPRQGIVPARPPDTRSLEVVRQAAGGCTACSLYINATQTVFGAGSSRPSMVLVGEQPGDQEDREGLPFVGPAGAVLEQALSRAGIDPEQVYTTNAVKHFKWRPTSGKRRLHDRPDRNEIEICKPWLAKELQLLSPDVVVALGTTAATSLLGKNVTIAANRGRPLPTEAAPVLVTYHPSSVLRQPDSTARRQRLQALVDDLRRARQLIVRASATGSE